MTTLTVKLATILMIGAALAATPVLAQSAGTAGNKGPSEVPANRDAPLSLPGELTPMPTPVVDAATTRDIFALDPAQALESLGTVTIDRGGDVTEAPASDAMRAIFEANVKGNKG
jgi:hypothetical protein